MKARTPSLIALPQRLSLVAQTVQSLREGLRAGHWQEHLPAERELSRDLQVGRKTLRAALKELEREGCLEVTPGQRRSIQPQPPKHGRITQKRTVGILMPSPLQTMHSRRMLAIDAVRDILAKAGCQTALHISTRCFSAHPARALEKLVRDHPGVVWVIFGSKEPMQRWFIGRQLPCLIIGSCRPGLGLPSIDVDHRAACLHAGNLLWRRGHRRFALVLPLDAFDGDVNSEQGLREALSPLPEAQLQVLRHDGTKAHLCALLDEAMRAATPPSAFVVARAIHALTVATHLMRRGKQLPRDVAVISRDEEPFLQSASPAIACYSISLPLHARRVSLAARQLAESGALPAQAIRLLPRFVAGESV